MRRAAGSRRRPFVVCAGLDVRLLVDPWYEGTCFEGGGGLRHRRDAMRPESPGGPTLNDDDRNRPPLALAEAGKVPMEWQIVCGRLVNHRLSAEHHDGLRSAS